MEINAGYRPEQLLRGMDRMLAVVAEALPRLSVAPRHSARVPARWLIERGETRIEAAVAVLGGFPGSLRCLNRLEKVGLVCSARYLVVGEGTPHGFAVPMRDLLAVSMVRPNRHSNHGLVIWYQDGATVGSFFIAFRGVARGISGLRRADAVLQLLIERGVAPLESAGIVSPPALHVTWDEAERYHGETILWSGDGIASVGGWFGARRDTCRVWLTESSLLWAGATQNGVNSIALADILEARDGAGDRVCIGIRDRLGHRYDLAFDLAIDHLETDRHANPRVQLMEALARHGVTVTMATVPSAPWRPGGVIRPMDGDLLPSLV